MSSSSSSRSSGSSGIPFVFPPPGYYLDQEGRLWRISSSSSHSSESSSSSSLSSESSSSDSSSSDSSSSESSSSDSSSSSSQSSSSSSQSSSSSSESSESSESSSSSNSSSSQSSNSSFSSSSVSSSSVSSSSVSSSSSDSSSSRDSMFAYPPEGLLMDYEGRMWKASSSSSILPSSSSSSSSSSSYLEELVFDDITDEEVDKFIEELGGDTTTNDSDNDSDSIATNDIDITSNDTDEIVAEDTPAVEPAPKTDDEVADCNPAHGCLTSNDAIRRFVLDRMIDDNVIDLELYFTDEEINHARYLAVANWNEIPPYVGAINLTTCDDCLPYPTIFVNGISYYLYLSKVQKIQKEDLDYNAGGMQVDLNKRRIAHLTSNIKFFKEEFVSLAAARKTHINYQGAWGQIG